jgi:Ni,Fe-hydrogenase I large subunit
MIIKKLIEKLEGDATLDFTFNKGKIEDVKIGFALYRGIEGILAGKDPYDALVITPRVCGICNHAHLIAAVKALEDGYRNAGVEVILTEKAQAIREFTLACELIQNHAKWFWMTMLPQLEKLTQIENYENHALKASYLSSIITKALAIFAGQWPHSSYAVPGGVTCDPTHVEIIQAEEFVDEGIRFVEQMLIGMDLDTYLAIGSTLALGTLKKDFGRALQLLGENGMSEKGHTHDRFIVFGDSILSPSGKCTPTTVYNADPKYVDESGGAIDMAKTVKYKQRLFEVGPLARAMVSKKPIVKNLHKRYKDSVLTRIFARVHEMLVLLEHSKALLQNISLSQESCTVDTHKIPKEFEGIGVTEAARGSLIHKTSVTKGLIERYEIIVPTQWNLSHGDTEEQGVAVKAMVGSSSVEEAAFIFRSFDVCSVCTMH